MLREDATLRPKVPEAHECFQLPGKKTTLRCAELHEACVRPMCQGVAASPCSTASGQRIIVKWSASPLSWLMKPNCAPPRHSRSRRQCAGGFVWFVECGFRTRAVVRPTSSNSPQLVTYCFFEPYTSSRCKTGPRSPLGLVQGTFADAAGLHALSRFRPARRLKSPYQYTSGKARKHRKPSAS